MLPTFKGSGAGVAWLVDAVEELDEGAEADEELPDLLPALDIMPITMKARATHPIILRHPPFFLLGEPQFGHALASLAISF